MDAAELPAHLVRNIRYENRGGKCAPEVNR